MTQQELLDFPITDIAEKNCLLFMWATSPLLNEAIPLGEHWGFKYATVAFVWYKKTHFIGFYTMSSCELCLIFKRGKIPQPRGKMNVLQYLEEKRREHSRKPDTIRDRITEMFPTQSKIELFARPQLTDLFGKNPQDGWDVWGNMDGIHDISKYE